MSEQTLLLLVFLVFFSPAIGVIVGIIIGFATGVPMYVFAVAILEIKDWFWMRGWNSRREGKRERA